MDAASIAAAVTPTLAVGAVVWYGSARFARLEFKVDTMWDFQIRRGLSELVEKGIGKMNSPLVLDKALTPKVVKALDPIKGGLHEIGVKHKKDSDAMLEIEAKYGDELLRTICVPLGLSHSACLIVALAVAKGTNTVDLTL
jgi:hypothetical protein